MSITKPEVNPGKSDHVTESSSNGDLLNTDEV